MYDKKLPLLSVTLCIFAAVLSSPAQAQHADNDYDYRERTRELAFDPQRFFPEGTRPWMEIIYSGDDYGFPVYSIAIQKGCTSDDTGEARRNCGNRLIARMVRAPFDGEPLRPRNRGQVLFGYLFDEGVGDDLALRDALARYQLEWLETDVSGCEPAMALLEADPVLSFFATQLTPSEGIPQLALHADKIRFVHRGSYLSETTYYGWAAPESPGEWAVQFAQSLEACWRPASSIAPWERD
ncbi:hypothetical protein [Aurantiacibacter marinus]|uniref:TonB C-terminal domain-containing protein n=1 Tax=Aurantiacibacter marinus TaxID=874156 RepID=A0A0H0XL98_9SPHN|nr:hypothetical protein [Aurantiacibacter marinus]KLI63129.1 hypothetical protein AAV99_10530 [Aurantiacibacter marinus]